jgi:hypothetical protein
MVWFRRSWFSVLLTVCQVGCLGAHGVPVGNVGVQPPPLVTARVGTRAGLRLELVNTGTLAVRVQVAVDDPFVAATDSVVVGLSEPAVVLVSARPAAYGLLTGTATVSGPGGPVAVPLQIEVPRDFDQDGFDDVGAGGPDCEDGDSAIHPDAFDVCDRIDNDCSGLADDDPNTHQTWYRDADGDGHGNLEEPRSACFFTANEAENPDDCDDGDATRYPGAPERTDGMDQDCDGWIDEHLYAPGSATVTEVFVGGGGVPPYLEVLVTSGFRVDLSAVGVQDLAGVGIGDLPARLADDREVLVLCPSAVGAVVDRPCDAVLDPFPTSGVQVVARRDPGAVPFVLDRLDWSTFSATGAAALELSPERLAANRNDGRGSWCTSQWPLDVVFGTPGTVAGHCGAPE